MEDQRKEFFIVNFESIKNDIARGNGDALSGLLNFSNCKESNDVIIVRLKAKSIELFHSNAKATYNDFKSLLGNTCII